MKYASFAKVDSPLSKKGDVVSETLIEGLLSEETISTNAGTESFSIHP